MGCACRRAVRRGFSGSDEAAHGCTRPHPAPTGSEGARPRAVWPEWLVWAQNRIWCWDVTHFPRARRCAFAIVDVVSRKWIATLLSPRGDLHPGAGPLQPGPRDRRPGGSLSGRSRVQIPPPATNENPWSRGYRMDGPGSGVSAVLGLRLLLGSVRAEG